MEETEGIKHGVENMRYDEVMKKLRSHANPKNVEGMARFGINPKNTLGVSIPILRKTAKETGRDHELADKLWKSGVHEARILAGMIDDPKLVTEKQMENWAKEFDSWDVCDQICMNLFDRTPIAYEKAIEWSDRKEEFVKRAGFALMACLVWYDKNAKDQQVREFFPLIVKHSTDERNFVKKAVNWALRQIGKKRPGLKKEAIRTAEIILKKYPDSKSARWIANDALRELRKK
jgi:3-methyladenine DNA glycosylase AlkD